MKLSTLLNSLFLESEYTSKQSLGDCAQVGEDFVKRNLAAKSGTMKKLDNVFDLLTDDVTVEDFLAAIEFLKKIKKDDNE